MPTREMVNEMKWSGVDVIVDLQYRLHDKI